MTQSRRLFAALLCALPIAGCGQKGPLYLPGNPSEVKSEVPSTNASTVPDDEDEDERDEKKQR